MNNLTLSFDIQQEPLVLSKSIIDSCFNQKYPADCMALYTLYYYTAKWQRTNQIYATTKYVALKLVWSLDRVRRTKKELIKLKLIEEVQRKNEKNQFTKPYIKVNFIWSRSTIAEKISRSKGFPESGVSQTSEKQETCALSVNSSYSLSDNKDMLFEKFWDEYDKKINKAKVKKKFQTLSDTIIEKIFDHLPQYVKSTPDKQFRKDPLKYLNNECWNDEIIKKGNEIKVKYTPVEYQQLVGNPKLSVREREKLQEDFRFIKEEKLWEKVVKH